MDEDDSSSNEETSTLLRGSSKSDSVENNINSVGFCSRFFCCRNVLVFLQFCGFITVYGMRANLSVALVAMVNQTFAEQTGNKIFKPECRKSHGNSSDDDAEDGNFNWDQQTQGYVLSSFFYGYIITQLPGGWLAHRYGGKKVLGYGIFMTALFTGLTPIAAKTHVLFLIAVRVLAGFGEGITYPAATNLWSRWATPLERSTYIVFAFSGGDFGAIFSLALSGWLSSLKFDGGWPLAFYVFGALGIFWFFFWMVLVHENPSQHPRIAQWEKLHILNGIGSSQDRITKKKPIPTPWKSIFTSPPVWALAMLGFSYGWGWYVFLACLPSFFKEVLDFNIQENGVLTALPFIASWTIKNVSARLSDLLQKRFSCTVVRKAFSFLSLLLGASLLLPVGFLKCSQNALSIVLLTISCGALGLYAPTGATNPMDLSPRFASIVMSIANVGTNIPGILSPVVAGYLTNHDPTRKQWQKVFFITCGIYAFGIIFFSIFGSGKEQPWNSSPGTKADDEDDVSSITGRRELFCKPEDGPDIENSLENSTKSSHSAVI